MSFLSILNPFRNPSPLASPTASPAFIGPVASPTASDSICDSEGFYQHLGECWNDSIQMIFLFSDGLKEIVQPALLDPNFDSKVESIINNERNKLFFLFNSDLKGLNTTNLGAVNNLFANNSTKAVLGSKVRERKNAIIEYFKVLKKRFMRHYTNEHLRRDGVCDEETANDHHTFQTMSEISRAAGKDGIAAAALGHKNTEGVNRSYINIEELKKKRKEEKYSPGGNLYDEYYLFNLYKLVFFSNYQFNFSLFQSTFTIKEEKLNYSIDLSEISNDIINNSKAIFIASSINNEKGHATAFYTCGGSEIYYDDNTGIYPFRWKEFLLKAVELYKNDDSTKLFCGTNTEITDRVEIQTSSFYPIIRTGETTPFTYYTFIQDSPLLESRNGKFEYNGVSVKMRDINETGWLSNEEKSIRKIYELIFITINNNQAVNAQRFNHTARHGSINWDYFYKLITQPNPDTEKILQFLNEYIQSNIFKHDKSNKENLSYYITETLRIVRPINPELNNKLLELAATQLDSTEVEKLRTKIPLIWMDEFGGIDNKYLDTLIAARDSEGILKVFTEFLNSNNFTSEDRSARVFIYSYRVFKKFLPVNLELNEKLFELIKDDLGKYKEQIQKAVEFLKANQGSKGGYRKRKTRYQKRLIKRKTQKKRRSRR